MKIYTYECKRIEWEYIAVRADTEDQAKHHLTIELDNRYKKDRTIFDETSLHSVNDGTPSIPSLQNKNGKLSIDLTAQQRTPAPTHIQNILKEADLILEEEDENF